MADRTPPSLLSDTPPLRVAVVAASPLVRAGLHAAMRQAGLEVLVAVASSAELVAAWPAHTADVVVLDSAAIEVHDNFDGWPAIVLLVDADDAALAQWLADGTTLVSRHAPAAQIAAAASAAASGLVAATRELMSQALRFAQLHASTHAGPQHEPLTARETQVLEKLAQGLGNKAIAQALHISTHTAKFHVAQIIAKLEASSRAHAVAKALRAGLLERG